MATIPYLLRKRRTYRNIVTDNREQPNSHETDRGQVFHSWFAAHECNPAKRATLNPYRGLKKSWRSKRIMRPVTVSAYLRTSSGRIGFFYSIRLRLRIVNESPF